MIVCRIECVPKVTKSGIRLTDLHSIDLDESERIHLLFLPFLYQFSPSESRKELEVRTGSFCNSLTTE